MTRYTPRQLAAVFRKIADRELGRATENGMKAGLRFGRNVAIELLPRRGVLRSIFGRKPKGIGKLIKVRRTQLRGSVLTGTLELSGLVAIQEIGGRTKAHVIAPKNRKALRFESGGGTKFSRFGVKHPGSRFSPIPAADAIQARTTPRIALEIERRVAELFAKHNF